MKQRTVLSLVITALFLYVVYPLLVPILMGAILAVIFFPFKKKLVARKMGQGLSSFLVTIGVTLGILVPLAFLGILATKAALRNIHAWKSTPFSSEWLINYPLARIMIRKTASWFHLSTQELRDTVQEFAKTAGMNAGGWLGDGLSRLPAFGMAMAIMVLSVYFFLADGERLLKLVRKASVLSHEHTERFIQVFARMCRSVVLASVITGLAQAVIFAAACLVAGVGQVVMVGFLIFVCSFLPLVGSLPVTATFTIVGFIQGGTTSGIIMLVGAVVCGLIDNIIRPVILRGTGNLHPLLGFVSAFGGLHAIGFAGVFLGPIVAGLFVATILVVMEKPVK